MKFFLQNFKSVVVEVRVIGSCVEKRGGGGSDSMDSPFAIYLMQFWESGSLYLPAPYKNLSARL